MVRRIHRGDLALHAEEGFLACLLGQRAMAGQQTPCFQSDELVDRAEQLGMDPLIAGGLITAPVVGDFGGAGRPAVRRV